MSMRSIGLAVAATALSLTGAARAMEAPVAVSPGDAGRAAVVSGTCPTFHWSEIDSAATYELVLFRLGPDGERTTEVYRVELPGRAQGWTPTLERCLEPGTRYAWALRAVGSRGEAGPWSQARIFEIAGAPSVSEVEQALDVLRRWRDRDEDGTVETAGPVPDGGEAVPRPAPLGTPDRPTQAEGSEVHVHEHGARHPESPGERTVPVPAAAPVLGAASLTIDQQLHLGDDSHVFKHGEVLLWEDEAAGITGFGHGALGANTTGLNNTATGTLAMHENTIGSNNTAMGHSALGDNTEGIRNTAVGSDALHLNTTGFNNTGVGYAALGDNSTGVRNTAVGVLALHEADTGNNNTAMGMEALGGNSAGDNNAAFGYLALHGNTTGSTNTALGTRSLFTNVSGAGNAAVGFEALELSTGSFNVAVGFDALGGNTSGANNTAVGAGAGINATTGSENIYVGSGALGVAAEGNTIRIGGSAVGTGVGEQNRAFINGIRGVTTGAADALAVVIDSNGQLGTVSSSRRFKQDIRDMGGASSRLLDLRPVTFRFKQARVDGEHPIEYGLIAEEVAKDFPELVVYSEGGRPEAVKYHLLSTLLLNELQQLDERNQELEERLRRQEKDLDRLKVKVAKRR